MIRFVLELVRWAMDVRAWNDPDTVAAIRWFTLDPDPACGVAGCEHRDCQGSLILRVGWR